MRTSQENEALRPIRQAAIPAPEQPATLPQPDPTARRAHHDAAELERLREAAARRPGAPAAPGRTAELAAEAVRRKRTGRKKQSE
jgi:hypothetical protein